MLDLVSFFTEYIQNSYITEFSTQSKSFRCLNHAKRPNISGDIKYFRFEMGKLLCLRTMKKWMPERTGLAMACFVNNIYHNLIFNKGG
jgi:hypothetical protein